MTYLYEIGWRALVAYAITWAYARFVIPLWCDEAPCIAIDALVVMVVAFGWAIARGVHFAERRDRERD